MTKNITKQDSEYYEAWQNPGEVTRYSMPEKYKSKDKTLVRMPDHFPGISELQLNSEKCTPEKIEEKIQDPYVNITMEDIERVLSPRKLEGRSRRRKNIDQKINGAEYDSKDRENCKNNGSINSTATSLSKSISSDDIGRALSPREGFIGRHHNNGDRHHKSDSGGKSDNEQSFRVKELCSETIELEDIDEVRNIGSEKYPDKLPKIAQDIRHSSTSRQAMSRRGSAHFNVTRMMTELDDLFQMNTTTDEPQDKLLSLKTVHEARRNSVFSPRPERSQSHHVRCRSVPNMDMQDLPQRFFVKLDPLRASATPINLQARNDSSRRCRTLSDNLRKLDKSGIALSDEERKRLIGEWVRETAQRRFNQERNQKFES